MTGAQPTATDRAEALWSHTIMAMHRNGIDPDGEVSEAVNAFAEFVLPRIKTKGDTIASRVMALFRDNPNRHFTAAKITEHLGEEPPTVRGALTRLRKAGAIQSTPDPRYNNRNLFFLASPDAE